MKRIVSLAFLVVGIVCLYACNNKVESGPSFIFKKAPSKEAIAKVDNKVLTEGELFGDIKSELYEAQMKVYNLKMAKLKSHLLQVYIDKDPKKKGLSNDEFLEKHIASKATVTEEDIQAFAKERKIPQLNEQLKTRIRDFISENKKREAIEAWLDQKLREKPVEVYLEKPMRPTYKIVAGDSPFMGGKNAKVEVVEFSDFQCPYCARATDIIGELKKKYGDKIKVVFKNFPLPFHKDAHKAAEAGLCANDQGKFWKMHDAMFADQSKLKVDDLKATAKRIGLDSGAFDKCIDSHKYHARLDKTIQEGKDAGVKSTPTFYVNGQQIQGAQPIEVFQELIDAELAK